MEQIYKIFSSLSSCDAWSVFLLKIKETESIQYESHKITLSPNGIISDFIRDLVDKYTRFDSGVLGMYDAVDVYDGSSIGTSIYKFSTEDDIIEEAYNSLTQAIKNSEREGNPENERLNAYFIQGLINFDESDHPVKLFSLRTPTTVLKNRFRYRNGVYEELTDRLFTLRSTIDAVIVDNDIYFLTMDAEKLFGIERAYKKICNSKVEELITCSFISDPETFQKTATSGHNPRRFASYNQNRVNHLGNESTRVKWANYFGIGLDGSNFDTSNPTNIEKIIKLICNKGMADPFEDAPVEVAGSKKWK